jgi:protein gp37
MSDTTRISWTEHTWNPWEGCTQISPGCGNCYIFAQLRRRGRDPARLRRTGTWGDPDRWNATAAEAGVPALVFTCSLSDFFHEDADEWRPEAWQVIRRCQHLRFQILTKRPFRVAEHLPPDWSASYENVWLGVSIEDAEHVWRADVLRKIPTRTRFISAEPLLGPLPNLDLRGFHWLIVGGESGPGYRPMDRNWARQLRDMAKARGVAFFFKQSSAFRPGQGDLLDGRRWHEFPAITAPGNQEPGEDAQPEEVPVAGKEQDVEDSRQQELQREEIERLQAEVERAQKEVERLRTEQQQRENQVEVAWAEVWVRDEVLAGTCAELNEREQEVKFLHSERDRIKLWGESLRADLEKQRQQAAVERKNWEAQLKALERELSDARFHLSMAELEAVLWKSECVAHGWDRFRGHAPNAGAGTVPLSVQQDLALLGLPWPCTREDLKKAHRAAVMKYHPERNLGDKQAEENFKKTQAAYDRLCDEFDKLGIR